MKNFFSRATNLFLTASCSHQLLDRGSEMRSMHFRQKNFITSQQLILRWLWKCRALPPFLERDLQIKLHSSASICQLCTLYENSIMGAKRRKKKVRQTMIKRMACTCPYTLKQKQEGSHGWPPESFMCQKSPSSPMFNCPCQLWLQRRLLSML